MKNSRNIGATFERKVARELHLLTGVRFQRDLDQYRERDRGDLIADDEDWPFVIECKRRASGGFQASWWEQVRIAAAGAGQPAVIWQISRQPIRVRVKTAILRPGLSGELDMTLDGFAELAADLMAETVGGV